MAQIALQDYLRKIDELLEENRLAEVKAHCRHILQKYPRHVDTYRILGKALLEQQKHNDAADIFYRVLSADPEDFIAHAGLAIIAKENGDIPRGIWHMERAFEMDPYNGTIQRELKDLYGRRDGLEPERISLTRGALARLYVRGELYQQAASELREALNKEPDRIDLLTLLAETLWRDDQRVDAVEVCLKIVGQLPYTVKANAILAEVWLITGRIDEAQTYLQRLKSLTVLDATTCDPESVVGRAFSTEGYVDLPPVIMFEELDYIPSIEAEAGDADWVKEFGIAAEAATGDTDWLQAMGSEGDLFDEEPSPEAGEEEVLDWLREVAVTDREELVSEDTDGSVDPLAAQASSETGKGVGPAETIESPELAQPEADWLSEIDASAEADFWGAAPDSDSISLDESEDGSGDAATEAEWPQESTGKMSVTSGELADSDRGPALGEIAQEQGIPDWLTESSSTTGSDVAGGALPDWLDEPDEAAEPEGEVLPDWLTANDEASESDVDVLPDWLADSVSEAERVDQGDKGEESETLPDWLADDTDEPDGLDVVAGVAALATGAALVERLTDDDRQEADGEPDSSAEMPDIEQMAADGEGLPDWLVESAAGDELVAGIEEIPDWLTETEASATAEELASLPDWLTEQPAQERDKPADEADDRDVLDTLAGVTAVAAGAVLASELADGDEQESGDEPDSSAEALRTKQEFAGIDELPDWLAESVIPPTDEELTGLPDWLLEQPGKEHDAVDQIDESDRPEALVDLTAMATGAVLADELMNLDADEPFDVGESEIPEWLESSQRALEEQVMGTVEDPEKDQEDIPEVPEEDLEETMRWLEELAAAQGTDPDELPSIQDSDFSQPQEPVSEDVSFMEESIPDWLQMDLDETVLAEEEIPDWLQRSVTDDQLSESPQMPEAGADFPTGAAEEVTPEDDLPDWLRAQMPDDLDLSSPTDFGDDSEELADELSWLDQIAAGEGNAIEELPTLSWEKSEIEQVESTDLGGDELADDQTWLEQLEVEPDVPLDDLPTFLVESAGSESQIEVETEPGEVDDFLAELDAVADEELLEEFDFLTEPGGDSVDLEGLPGESAAADEAALDEIPEDPDEAMAWLERLAAEQGAPLDELPSLSEEPEILDDAPEAVAVTVISDRLVEPEVVEDQPELAETLIEPAPDFGADEIAAAPEEATAWLGEETPVEKAADVDATVAEIPDDPDEAMAWLEQLAAQQGAPAEELPTIRQSEDVRLSADEPAEDLPDVEHLLDGVEVPAPAEAEASLSEVPDDPDEAMAWLEQLAAKQGAPVEELPSLTEPAAIDELDVPEEVIEVAVAVVEAVETAETVEVEEEIDLELEQALAELGDIEMPADDDEALAWLAALGGIEDRPQGIDEMPTPPAAHKVVGPPEVVEETPASTPEAVGAEDAVEELAWLAESEGAGDAEAQIVDEAQAQVTAEMPTPPTAHEIIFPPEIVDETEIAEPEVAVEDDDADAPPAPEIAEAVDEVEVVPVEPEAEMAEDEDEAMAWLEQLAARQGAPLDELASVDHVEKDVQTPEWVSHEAEEAPPEAFFEPEAEVEEAEEAEELFDELSILDEEMPPDIGQELAQQDVTGALPDWLSPEGDGDEVQGELDWLDSFGDTDLVGWLEAEEQTMTDMPIQGADTGPVAPPAAPESLMEEPVLPDMTFELDEIESAVEGSKAQSEVLPPAMPPVTGPLLDSEKLGEARSALEAGNIDQMVKAYTDLLEQGQGVPTVIADLEMASGRLGPQPRLKRLLGDAYMQNGQLQKALEMYRQALDQL